MRIGPIPTNYLGSSPQQRTQNITTNMSTTNTIFNSTIGDGPYYESDKRGFEEVLKLFASEMPNESKEGVFRQIGLAKHLEVETLKRELATLKEKTKIAITCPERLFQRRRGEHVVCRPFFINQLGSEIEHVELAVCGSSDEPEFVALHYPHPSEYSDLNHGDILYRDQSFRATESYAVVVVDGKKSCVNIQNDIAHGMISAEISAGIEDPVDFYNSIFNHCPPDIGAICMDVVHMKVIETAAGRPVDISRKIAWISGGYYYDGCLSDEFNIARP
jgi:hypothetical protein